MTEVDLWQRLGGRAVELVLVGTRKEELERLQSVALAAFSEALRLHISPIASSKVDPPQLVIIQADHLSTARHGVPSASLGKFCLGRIYILSSDEADLHSTQDLKLNDTLSGIESFYALELLLEFRLETLQRFIQGRFSDLMRQSASADLKRGAFLRSLRHQLGNVFLRVNARLGMAGDFLDAADREGPMGSSFARASELAKSALGSSESMLPILRNLAVLAGEPVQAHRTKVLCSLLAAIRQFQGRPKNSVIPIRLETSLDEDALSRAWASLGEAEPNLVHAFSQIIENAAQAQILRQSESIEVLVTQTSSTLDSQAAQGGGFWRVEVRDRGPGLSPEVFARIGIAGNESIRSGRPGLGILASLRIFNSYGGSLWCRNRPGGGAEFLMELPDGS
jgi:signal transduction histidine kinase